MLEKSPTARLEIRIEKFFDAYSVKCLAKASFVVGLTGIGSSLLAYFLTLNPLIALGVFLFVGLVMVNLTIILFVPPTRKLNESRALLINAVKRPSLIKNVNAKHVEIKNKKDEVKVLNSYEQKAWDTIVMPFFFRATASREKIFKQSLQAQTKKGEIEALDARYKERVADEASFLQLKAQIESERAELERRYQELSDAENMAIDRLNEVEEAEAHLAQLRDDLNADTNRLAHEQEPEQIKRKEAELLAKEAEIEALKLHLLEDQRIVEDQKTELNQMKGEILHEMDIGTSNAGIESVDTNRAVEERLRAREQQLERMARELEERSNYVDSVEESLVERLGQLTEREAFLEQGEINQGVRKE